MSASPLPTKAAARNSLLVSYLAQLNTHPLRTKCVTLGVLTFLQEVLATHLAGVPVRNPPKDAPSYRHALAQAKVEQKAFTMALYGGLVSAPLGHVLVGTLQKAFAGRTGKWAKFGQILASNLLVAPIQTVVYLACMAVINGGRTVDVVVKTVKGGFMAVIRVMWISSPLSMLFAQRFLAPELWVPFFNLVGFTMGTYFNTRVKQLRLAAEKKAKKEKEDRKTQ
ncbi:uncharacterized protein STEHIDRAFT_143598 [Stereum hirsutum FP-91666 SS1]|uniref:uncharacterized protein n=1 Tax=Stereum hirsutum (strain FP-91666) TaxID=721885 RepID=UPI000440BA9E|nr:uncharacterized protein STEHIDRAFT_143598 [Stereum hirsutum FP-91666 SS1]EIM92161.1 hypothetical protein STEHIDRAFT_143598 [Stereum hirsutum FP-91666 SS1]